MVSTQRERRTQSHQGLLLFVHQWYEKGDGHADVSATLSNASECVAQAIDHRLDGFEVIVEGLLDNTSSLVDFEVEVLGEQSHLVRGHASVLACEVCTLFAQVR